MPVSAVSALGSAITFSRSSPAQVIGPSFTQVAAAAGVPRIAFSCSARKALGLMVEDRADNAVRNPAMSGLAAGSPGTLPTNYTSLLVSGLTRSLETFSEGGMTGLAMRLAGMPATPTPYGGIYFETTNGIAASVGQTWCVSCHVKQLAGAIPLGAYLVMIMQEYSSGGTLLTETNQVVPWMDFGALIDGLRYAALTVRSASCAYVRPALGFFPGTADARYVDFKAGLAAPQMELGYVTTSRVPPPASPPAVSARERDYAYLTGSDFTRALGAGSAGTIIAEFQTLRRPVNAAILPMVFFLYPPSGLGLYAYVSTGNGEVRFGPFGTVSAVTDGLLGLHTGGRQRIAITWGQGIAMGAMDGGPVVTGAIPSLGLPSQLWLGSFAGSPGTFLNGTIRSFDALPYRVDAATLQSLSVGGP